VILEALMTDIEDYLVDLELPRSRVAVLLDHFSELGDAREPERIMYPLSEVLFLVTCATICSCDDFDEIAQWGEHHLDFLRKFSEFHFGIPCERWLRILVNRIDPVLFGQCFDDWIASLWPGRHDLIAIDGKTSRRSHDRRKGLKALHTLSAYATGARLTLAQVHVPEKANEITAIPDLLDQLAEKGKLKGALVTIDAMGCQADIADKITAYGADFLLALKGNHPTLEAEVEHYFRFAPASETTTVTTLEKGHGRIETRIATASANTSWIVSDRSFPGQTKFKNIRTIVKIVRRVEYADRSTFSTHYYISSAPANVERLAEAVRGHWGVESMHWLLDVAFKDDLSRYRAGNGAKNMAVLRRFALNLVRIDKQKGSVKTKRKTAGWDTKTLQRLLQIGVR
jgi:predicted transposase YbfD/YdcC